jgi:hypothetical protein
MVAVQLELVPRTAPPPAIAPMASSHIDRLAAGAAVASPAAGRRLSSPHRTTPGVAPSTPPWPRRPWTSPNVATAPARRRRGPVMKDAGGVTLTVGVVIPAVHWQISSARGPARSGSVAGPQAPEDGADRKQGPASPGRYHVGRDGGLLRKSPPPPPGLSLGYC